MDKKSSVVSVDEITDGILQFAKPNEPLMELFRKSTQRYKPVIGEDGEPVIGADGKAVLEPDGKPFREVRLYSSKIKVYDREVGKSLTLEGYLPIPKKLALSLVRLGVASWSTASGVSDEEDAEIFDDVPETAWVVSDKPKAQASEPATVAVVE